MTKKLDEAVSQRTTMPKSLDGGRVTGIHPAQDAGRSRITEIHHARESRQSHMDTMETALGPMNTPNLIQKLKAIVSFSVFFCKDTNFIWRRDISPLH